MKRKGPASTLSTNAVDDDDVILIDSGDEQEIQPPPTKKQDIHRNEKKKPEGLPDSIWKALSKLVDTESQPNDENVLDEEVEIKDIANLYYEFNLEQIEQEITSNTILQPSSKATSSNNADLYFQFCIQRYKPPSLDQEQEPQIEEDVLQKHPFFIEPKDLSSATPQQQEWMEEVTNPIQNQSITLLTNHLQ